MRYIVTEAVVRFMEACRERHVSWEEESRVLKEMTELTGEDARSALLTGETERIFREYAFIPMETYLASIEESKDWEDLTQHRCVYWQDVPSMLADAVRTRSVQTVRQLAIHCLFRNPQLKAEMLALAPDQRTRRALMYPPRLYDEARYLRYPFCVSANGITGIYEGNPQSYHYRLLRCPDGVQEALFAGLAKEEGYDDSAAFADMLGREEADGMLEYRLYCLGYHQTEQGLVHELIPQSWPTDIDAADLQTRERCEEGVMGLMNEMHRQMWGLRFDGVNNRFGVTGYWYME